MDKNKKINLLVAAILMMFFIIITALVVTDNIAWFDDSVYNFIIGLRSNPLDFILKTITRLGDTVVIMIIVVLTLIILNKRERVIFGSSTIITVTLNQTIKHILQRPRPDHLRLIKQGGFSYPSGHSMIAVCVYGIMIYLINKKVQNKKLKIALSILLTILILTIGISRIYVGVHYPSDVLGGFILSTVILLINLTFTDKIYGGILNEKNGNK
jgi:undecaprenyl-diphosphatase